MIDNNTEEAMSETQELGIIADTVEAYSTTDFDLAAYLMAKKRDGKTFASVIDMVPLSRKPGLNPGAGHRFRFILLPTDAGVTINDLRAEELAYANQGALIEPINYMAVRKQLRVLLDRKIHENEQKLTRMQREEKTRQQ